MKVLLTYEWETCTEYVLGDGCHVGILTVRACFDTSLASVGANVLLESQGLRAGAFKASAAASEVDCINVDFHAILVAGRDVVNKLLVACVAA